MPMSVALYRTRYSSKPETCCIGKENLHRRHGTHDQQSKVELAGALGIHESSVGMVPLD